MKRGKTDTEKRGILGERAAVRYLRRRLYRILERNWFFYRKEVDIIARRGRTLVICEVKTRTQSPFSPSTYGPPSAAVNSAKQCNLIVAGRAYARSRRWRGKVRMDIIEVYLSAPNEKGHQKIEKIVHLKDAFPA